MRSDWKEVYSRRLHKLASDRGKRMAAARWLKDRVRRDRLAKVTAEQYPNRIVRRVIVIDDEQVAREAVIFEWDSIRDAKHKIRKAMLRE